MMKRFLAALFLCLACCLPALAEDDLFDRAAGLWVWDPESGDAPLGGGVYFRVDGSALLYDAAEITPQDGVRRLTLRNEGTWEVSGDTLLLIADERVQTFTVERHEWNEEGDWPYGYTGLLVNGYDGQGVYMSGDIDYLGINVESVIPEGVRTFIRAFHPDDVFEDYAELANVPGGPMAFALIHDGERRMLQGLRWTGSKWETVLDVVLGIPQLQSARASVSTGLGGGRYSGLWESEAYNHLYPDGPVLGVWTDNGEYEEEGVTYVFTDGDFHLVQYRFSPNCQVDIVGDELVFFNISWGLEGRARADIPTRITSVNFYSLPKHVQDVRISGTDEPALPISDEPNALVKQNVTLRKNQKYPVYMGPGKRYGRLADGKAMVSTNGWVQVFGEYDEYLLIQYAVSADRYRFGWITDDALPKGATVPELPFVFGDFVTTEAGLDLTDDPLNSHTPLLTFEEWDAMERLAYLGDGYAYVRVTRNGKTWWGFVYAWPLGHG